MLRSSCVDPRCISTYIYIYIHTYIHTYIHIQSDNRQHPADVLCRGSKHPPPLRSLQLEHSKCLHRHSNQQQNAHRQTMLMARTAIIANLHVALSANEVCHTGWGSPARIWLGEATYYFTLKPTKSCNETLTLVNSVC